MKPHAESTLYLPAIPLSAILVRRSIDITKALVACLPIEPRNVTKKVRIPRGRDTYLPAYQYRDIERNLEMQARGDWSTLGIASKSYLFLANHTRQMNKHHAGGLALSVQGFDR